MQTQSIVKTQFGQSYMKRLCRHWGHKVSVELNENDALIQLPFGPCRILVDDTTMTLEIDVSSEWPVERAERMVGSHLVRMANKDDPEVIWQRQGADS